MLRVVAAAALLALIVVFGAVRPALKAAQPAAAPRLNAVVDDVQALPTPAAGLPQLEAPEADNRLLLARSLAKDNPAAVANIVRTWVAKEA